MRVLSILAGYVLVVCCLGGIAAAQGKKTVILVRHAERDTSESADPMDPPLTDQGRLRAAKLEKRIRRYRIGAIYSSDYRRTRETAAPIASRRHLAVQVYDPREPVKLIDQIMKSKIKRVLVVGHSNTIPQLANLLLKKATFKSLDDEEYGVIWIFKLKTGEVSRTQIITY